MHCSQSAVSMRAVQRVKQGPQQAHTKRPSCIKIFCDVPTPVQQLHDAAGTNRPDVKPPPTTHPQAPACRHQNRSLLGPIKHTNTPTALDSQCAQKTPSPYLGYRVTVHVLLQLHIESPNPPHFPPLLVTSLTEASTTLTWATRSHSQAAAAS